jgi:hypothetical protein
MPGTSGAQRRIAVSDQTIYAAGGGGGGGPTVVASLNIGPDFGDKSGNDDTTFISRTEDPDLAAVDFDGNLEDASVIDLDAVDFLGNLVNGGSIDFSATDFAGDLASTSQIDFFNLILDFDLLGSSAAVTFPSVDFEGNLIPAGAVDLESVDFEGGLTSSPSFYQATDANSSYANISDLLYTNVAMNTRQDSAGSDFIAFSTTVFGGEDPFLIRPVTVAGVTNDERVAYFKFDLTGIDGSFQSYALDFTFRVTNPSLLSAATITTAVRSTPSEPWPSPPYSWNNYEPVVTGSLEITDTESVAANSTEFITAQISRFAGDSARNDWVYIRITSDLVGTLVEITTADTDNNPATTPHQAPYVDLEIEFAP